MALQKLEKVINQAAFKFEQVSRVENAAIYKKTFRISGLCAGFAVFKIKVHENKEITGDYWTHYTLLEAQEQYARIASGST